VLGILLQENRDVTSVHDVFARTALRYVAQEFLHIPCIASHAGAIRPMSVVYGAARERVEQLRQAYVDAGYRGGHRVAIGLDNELEFFLHFLALNALGSSIVPLNAAMSLEEIAHLVTRADAAAVITHKNHATHIRAAVPALIAVEVVAVGDAS
jgi:acyl-CoA synthetase (AMP-forming)/AMP-acid ligase II